MPRTMIRYLTLRFPRFILCCAVALSIITSASHSQDRIGEKIFFSMDAQSLSSTCRSGFSDANESEAKGYCIGFIYAVTLGLEHDGWACTPADFGVVLSEAARLLSQAKENERSWDVLRGGFTEKFKCRSFDSPTPIPTPRPENIQNNNLPSTDIGNNITVLRVRTISKLVDWSIRDENGEFCIAEAKFTDNSYLRIAKTITGYFISLNGEEIYRSFMSGDDQFVSFSFVDRASFDVKLHQDGDNALLSDVIDSDFAFYVATSRNVKIRIGGDNLFQYDLGSSEYAIHDLDKCFRKLDAKPWYLKISLGAGGHDPDDENVRWTYEWKKYPTQILCEQAKKEADDMMFRQDTYTFWDSECLHTSPY